MNSPNLSLTVVPLRLLPVLSVLHLALFVIPPPLHSRNNCSSAALWSALLSLGDGTQPKNE